MSIDVAAALHDLAASISPGARMGSWVVRVPGQEPREVMPATPVDRLSARSFRHARPSGRSEPPPLLIGRTATDAVVRRAQAGELDILTVDPLCLVLAGRTHTLPTPPSRRPERPRGGKPAWVRWAVVRYLLLSAGPVRQRTIADALGTSQQAVSQAAKRLGPLLASEEHGMIASNRRALLEHWLTDYPGPGGPEFGWYGLDPATDQVRAAVRESSAMGADPIVSGEVAADLIAPWKLPARGRIYLREPVDLADQGFAPAPLVEATLIACVPRDPTLWNLVDLHSESRSLPTVDPLIVLWDLHRSGDADSRAAAEKVAELVIGPAR